MTRSRRIRLPSLRRGRRRDAFVVTSPLPGAEEPEDCDCPICAWLAANAKEQDEIAPGVFAAPLDEAEVAELQAVFASVRGDDT